MEKREYSYFIENNNNHWLRIVSFTWSSNYPNKRLHDWTSDPNLAWGFDSRESALGFIVYIKHDNNDFKDGITELKVTEHEFVSSRQSEKQSDLSKYTWKEICSGLLGAPRQSEADMEIERLKDELGKLQTSWNEIDHENLYLNQKYDALKYKADELYKGVCEAKEYGQFNSITASKLNLIISNYQKKETKETI